MSTMKLVMIAYSQTIDDEIWDVLAGGVLECTQWEKVEGEEDLGELVHLLLAVRRVLPSRSTGEGSQGSPGFSPLAGGIPLGTKSWSKLNNVLMVVLDDVLSGKIMDGVRDLQGQFGQERIKAFLLPCEEVI
jgi:hypothetical protein